MGNAFRLLMSHTLLTERESPMENNQKLNAFMLLLQPMLMPPLPLLLHP